MTKVKYAASVCNMNTWRFTASNFTYRGFISVYALQMKIIGTRHLVGGNGSALVGLLLKPAGAVVSLVGCILSPAWCLGHLHAQAAQPGFDVVIQICNSFLLTKQKAIWCKVPLTGQSVYVIQSLVGGMPIISAVCKSHHSKVVHMGLEEWKWQALVSSAHLIFTL